MEVSSWDDSKESKEEYDEQRSVVQTATDTLLFPLRVAASPPLLRTYLRTLLLLIASTILFAFAVVAYTSFYYSYIPIRGISIPVYLQFDHGRAPHVFLSDAGSPFGGREAQRWPHAVAGVQGLVNRQKYDVAVELTVPRSRTNLQAGNWMLDLSLRGPSAGSSNTIKTILGWDDESESDKDTHTATQILAHSRRPALLTYRSSPTEYLHRFLRLPLYLTGFGTESETLRVSMLESAYFVSSVPSSLRLELRSKTPLEVYGVSVHIRARLEGLRWVMYTHRLSSAVVLVCLFWATEMGVLLLTWGVISMLFGGGKASEEGKANEEEDKIKKEEKETDYATDTTTLSAQDRQFPTLSSQPPLRYSSPDHHPSTKAKKEEEEGEGERKLQDIPLAEEAEADDEDDDFVLQGPPLRVGEGGGFTDSGLGTGVDSERERVRKRGGRVKEG